MPNISAEKKERLMSQSLEERLISQCRDYVVFLQQVLNYKELFRLYNILSESPSDKDIIASINLLRQDNPREKYANLSLEKLVAKMVQLQMTCGLLGLPMFPPPTELDTFMS